MSEFDRAAISARLHESYKRAGFTQEQMADLLHVHKNTIGNWTSARDTNIPFDRLEEWAVLTQVSRYWLLYGEEAPVAPVGALESQLAEIASLLRDQQALVLELLRELRGSSEGRSEAS